MWPTIDRARRRISGGASERAVGNDRAAAASSDPASAEPAIPTQPVVEDVVIILRPSELEHLRKALQHALGAAAEHPDTPARFERALSMLLARRGVPGRPRVLRRPAGLSTPESWEIHLDGVEWATGTSVRDAARTGRFAP